MTHTPLADMVSGLAAATAVLAAIQQRASSGAGATIDMAMSDVARWLMLPALAQRQAGLPIGPEHANPLGGGWACYNRYRTADGRYLALGAVEPHFWARFCAALGRNELVAAQYEPAAQEQLEETIGAIIGEATLAEWLERFAGLDACVSPVLTLDEVDGLPQHRQRGYGMRFPA
jgi:alpha-methylacyl-CoA racemase